MSWNKKKLNLVIYTKGDGLRRFGNRLLKLAALLSVAALISSTGLTVLRWYTDNAKAAERLSSKMEAEAPDTYVAGDTSSQLKMLFNQIEFSIIGIEFDEEKYEATIEVKADKIPDGITLHSAELKLFLTTKGEWLFLEQLDSFNQEAVSSFRLVPANGSEIHLGELLRGVEVANCSVKLNGFIRFEAGGLQIDFDPPMNLIGFGSDPAIVFDEAAANELKSLMEV